MDEFALVENTYNKIANQYTNRYGDSSFIMRNIDKFSKLLPLKGKILDLGCGSGRAMKHFMDRGFDVVGIDFSEGMLKLARERISHANLRKMNMRKLEFVAESFDGIWSNFSLLHVPNREIQIVIKECFRVLKPNGIFYIAVGSGNDQESIEDEWLKKGEKMFFNSISKESLRAHLTVAGFKIEEINVEEDAPENDDHPILYLYARK
jgi:ubiquinone/menaquinone biosynthesis C-methylase UbiE